jgi:SSS family solute:Na+ symporter
MNSIYDKLTTLDFIIVAVYLVALLIIGYVVSVKQSKKTKHFFWPEIR